MTGQKNKKNPITYSGDVMWIKISTNIFDDEKIKLIEEMPEGDTIIVIWFKLLATAGRINDCGFVYLKENISYTNEMLATVFHRPINTVRMALQIFEQFGMISISDTNTILLNNWSKYQSMDRLEKIREQTRQRVAKYRESQKLLMSNKTCQYCGNIATGYDHIVALSRGGSDTEDNKVECCKECNQIKNDKPLVDFLNNYRDRIKDEIVCSNKKLTRFVQLCNVTDRYIVTPSNDIVTLSNATEEEVEEEVDKELDIDIDNNSTSCCCCINEEEKENSTTSPTPILNSDQKLYGEFGNVCLTNHEYGKLLSMTLDQKFLDQVIEELSQAIGVGKYLPYKADCPNAHFILLRKFIDWHKKHPESEQTQQKSNGYKTKSQELNELYDEIDRVCDELRRKEQENGTGNVTT